MVLNVSKLLCESSIFCFFVSFSVQSLLWSLSMEPALAEVRRHHVDHLYTLQCKHRFRLFIKSLLV